MVADKPAHVLGGELAGRPVVSAGLLALRRVDAHRRQVVPLSLIVSPSVTVWAAMGPAARSSRRRRKLAIDAALQDNAQAKQESE